MTTDKDEELVEEMDDVEMDSEGDDSEDEAEATTKERKAFIPGVTGELREGEELEFDPSAYHMLHSFTAEWPCLSFDCVPDGLGNSRSGYPAECYIVSGTQADKPKNNQILVMGLKNMWNFKQKKEGDDESSDDSSDEEGEEPEEKKPVMHAVSLRHYGGVNRVRSQRLGESTVCAVWNELGKVQIWNITSALNQANQMTGPTRFDKAEKYEVPLFTYEGAKQEGYGMAWSPTTTGDLATGDKVRNIYVWHMQEGGKWAIDRKPLTGHTAPIEDLAWSPNEAGLLASVSSDGSLRLWDTRLPPAQACVVQVDQAHDSDVNVLSWNAHDSLILTGGDDGQLKIWSLKNITHKQPVARFKYHKKPITSVEWHPTETTTFMASSEDNQTTIWDIAMEADGEGQAIEGVPPQLLFLHMGQKEVKELHWHHQIPGLCLNTAADGFNVFRPINM